MPLWGNSLAGTRVSESFLLVSFRVLARATAQGGCLGLFVEKSGASQTGRGALVVGTIFRPRLFPAQTAANYAKECGGFV